VSGAYCWSDVVFNPLGIARRSERKTSTLEGDDGHVPPTSKMVTMAGPGVTAAGPDVLGEGEERNLRFLGCGADGLHQS
jgi:hypothetical protein